MAGARLADGTVVRAATVVNAGGVWSDRIGRLGSDGGISIRPAKGIHVTVRADRLPCDFAAVLSVPGDRRSVFVVPWAADEAAGPGGGPATPTWALPTPTTTDRSTTPRCTAGDIEYVLGAVNAWTSAGLTPADVTATWAGLRPLISDARSARTADLSRRHKVLVSANGLVTVTGGKLTTYRKMAADTVDAVVSGTAARGGATGPVASAFHRARSRARRGDRGRSSTSRLRLVGGDHGGRPDASATADAHRLGISGAQLSHLAGRHGSLTREILDLCRERPELSAPLHPSLPYLQAEVVYAARSEMARTVTDVLARRTRALILDRAAAAGCAEVVGRLMAAELGWNEAEIDRQVGAFRDGVLAEVASETAVADRSGAPADAPADAR